MPGCEPCHCDETDCENEDPGDGASRRRANSSGQAMITSDDVNREVGHTVQKDIFGELISNWLVTALAALGFLVAGLFAALIASDPNVTQCTEHRARQSWSEWMVQRFKACCILSFRRYRHRDCICCFQICDFHCCLQLCFFFFKKKKHCLQ